jgi:hypothetical protein
MITSLTLMAGAWAIIFDPIFQGMAVSLLFGAGVATLMAVIIIPLGCISLRKRFYMETASDSAEMVLSPKYAEIEGEVIEDAADAEEIVQEYKTPLWMRLYSGIIGLFGWIFLILNSIFILLKMAVGAVLGKFGHSDEPPPPPPAASPPSNPPPSSPSSPTGGESAASEQATSAQAAAEAEVSTKVEQSKEAADKKQAASSVKRTPEKKADKKTVKKKTVKKKTESEKASAATKTAQPDDKTVPATDAGKAKKTAATKKAPSKKTSPSGRRGIRLKVDDD